jgi:hypothetical protein
MVSRVMLAPFDKDDGFGGHGALKRGLASMSVAFQSRRWNEKSFGRPEIGTFRSALKGRYEQRSVFTTDAFAFGAE